MSVLRVIFSIFNLLLFIHAAYFGLFGIWGLFRRRQVFEDTEERRHFAALIPARNEEAVIGNLVDSLLAADCPGGLVDVYVIVNNCTDRTAEIALDHGAKVIDCTVATKSKADVLRFAFDVLSGDPVIDAYAVFDADNVVDAGFFREINKALATGAPAVQCRRTGKTIRGNWVSSCYEMYYAMQNAYFNHPRCSAGLSASISGTGWVVRKDVIDRKGFDFNTITEDYEMTISYAIDGDRIVYCPDAVVYDEFTDNLRVSMRQRVRWTFGMVQCMKKYIGPLVKRALRGSRQCLDTAMLDILPLVMLLSIFTSLLAYFVMQIPLNPLAFFLGLALSFWLGMSISCVVAMIKSGSSIRDNIKGIIAFPVFIITWVPILISCFFRRNVEWTPIRHDQTVSIEDINKAE